MIILTKFDAFVSNTLLDAVTFDLKNHRTSSNFTFFTSFCCSVAFCQLIINNHDDDDDDDEQRLLTYSVISLLRWFVHLKTKVTGNKKLS